MIGRRGAGRWWSEAKGVNDPPLVMECGSVTGRATCTMLTACEEVDGRLPSIDIDNHADSAISDRWRFIRSDDRNLEYILPTPYKMEGRTPTCRSTPKNGSAATRIHCAWRIASVSPGLGG